MYDITNFNKEKKAQIRKEMEHYAPPVILGAPIIPITCEDNKKKQAVLLSAYIANSIKSVKRDGEGVRR